MWGVRVWPTVQSAAARARKRRRTCWQRDAAACSQLERDGDANSSNRRLFPWPVNCPSVLLTRLTLLIFRCTFSTQTVIYDKDMFRCKQHSQFHAPLQCAGVHVSSEVRVCQLFTPLCAVCFKYASTNLDVTKCDSGG